MDSLIIASTIITINAHELVQRIGDMIIRIDLDDHNGYDDNHYDHVNQVQKLGKLETAVGELGQRMDSTGRLADTLVAECSRKV